MPTLFLRCDQVVPGFVASLVAEGVDPTCLQRVNRQMCTSVMSSGRSVVAAQMQVDVNRLPNPGLLHGEPGDSFTKLSSAIVFGKQHVLAAPVHLQLQGMASAAGRTQRLELRFAPSMPKRYRIFNNFVYLPANVREAILFAYNRERVWSRVNVERPAPRNFIEHNWVRMTEDTANQRHPWLDAENRDNSSVYMHFGMVTAAMCMSSMPTAVAGSLAGAWFTHVLAHASACIAFLIFAFPDLVTRFWFDFQHRELHRAREGMKVAFTAPAFDKIWPELANPFHFLDDGGEMAQRNFDNVRKKCLLNCVHLHAQGESVPRYRDIAIDVEGDNRTPFNIDFPPPARAVLDDYWKKLVVHQHNERARPYLPSERVMVALADGAGFQRSQTWSACAVALAQAHRRRDASLTWPST